MKPDATRRATLLAGLLSALNVSAKPQAPLELAERILQKTTGAPVRPYSTRDFGRARYTHGRSVLVPEDRAEALVIKVRKELPNGLVAYVGVTNDLSGQPGQSRQKSRGVELAVAEGKDQFDILRVAATDGTNYDLNTEAIIKELAAWDREFGIDIWQAETDTIQLRLKKQPKDTLAFAKRVYKFCPDIVDQGTGSVEELARLIARANAVSLWWD
jgi:hypothetical protein